MGGGTIGDAAGADWPPEMLLSFIETPRSDVLGGDDACPPDGRLDSYDRPLSLLIGRWVPTVPSSRFMAPPGARASKDGCKTGSDAEEYTPEGGEDGVGVRADAGVYWGGVGGG
jgi:hypothetical protein